ncbi:MAG TPA: pentapeptide repeat-containing protein [Gemmatimonas sp.]|nr:pentapeptide repeat-containing protein [Gemmatimonas sp.]
MLASRWVSFAAVCAAALLFPWRQLDAAQESTIPPFAWVQWMSLISNTIKVVEGAAFMFGAYQVLLSRRERKAADIEAAARAIIDSNYQAWQVINSAQGKGGSGGRIEALQSLRRNGVSLAGITLDGAWLEGVDLSGATLVRASLRGSNLERANLAGANLEGADLRDANLVAANLVGATLKDCNIEGARLSAATLDDAELYGVVGWESVRSLSHASIEGLRRPPQGFVSFAREQGAVDRVTMGVPEGELEGYSREFRAV